jgi:iron complex transport system permease protein
MLPRSVIRISLPALALLLLVCSVAELSFGDLRLSIGQLWHGLLRQDELATTILWQIRIPRLLVAIAIGAALSSSGLVMQAYFRNSLASPGLLGVSSGGAAGAVVAIGLGLASAALVTVPVFSIIGALFSSLAVVGLARSGASTERLLLAGVALNALLGAVTSYVLSNFTLTYERNAQIIFWLLGGLEDRTWDHVWMSAPVFLVALLLWPLGRPMDLLSLGLSTLLTALATAVAGTVGFVGLVVPHLLRLLLGPEHRRLVPASLLGGAAFVVFCDLLGRAAGGLRLGIVTALIGGPFFLWLLRRKA